MPETLDQPIGPYTLEAQIGAGPLGEVYRARNTEGGPAVALKLLRQELSRAPGFGDRLRALADALRPIQHPRVVGLLNAGEHGGRFYLVSELVAGGSVRRLLAGGPLQPALIANLGRQAAEGLATIHSHGFAHGGVKPANLLIASDGGNLKLADAGLAYLANLGGETAADVVGEPAYLAPEQCQGLDPSAQSDIYSLGAVLYELAVGAPPFPANSLSAAISGHLFTPPPPPRQRRPDLSADLEALILRCLAKAPADRFADADELESALMVLQMRLPGAPSPALGTATVMTPAALAPPADPSSGTAAVVTPAAEVTLPEADPGTTTVVTPAPDAAPDAPNPGTATVVTPALEAAAPIDPPPAEADPGTTTVVTPTADAAPARATTLDAAVAARPADHSSDHDQGLSDADTALAPAVVLSPAGSEAPAAGPVVGADTFSPDADPVLTPDATPPAGAGAPTEVTPATPAPPAAPAAAEPPETSGARPNSLDELDTVLPARPVRALRPDAARPATLPEVTATPEPTAERPPAAAPAPPDGGAPGPQPAQPRPQPAGTPTPLNTPVISGGSTQSLTLGTPPPGFPALPPPRSVPLVQVLDERGQPLRLLDLSGEGITIGRAPGNDLVLDGEGISERHAQIDWNGSDVMVTDLDSKNGSALGRARLRPQIPQHWPQGAALQIGPFWLRLVPALATPLPSMLSIPTPVRGMAAVVAGTASAPIGAVTPSGVGVAMAARGPALGPSGIRPAGGSGPTGFGGPPGPGDLPSGVTPAGPASVNRLVVQLDEEATALNLTPDLPTTVRMTLYNQGGTTDHLGIEVQGIPPAWVQAAPPPIQLNPGGSAPATLSIKVPKAPESRADSYPVTVIARSREKPAEFGAAQANWRVMPYSAASLELKPRRADVWHKGAFRAVVTNSGNTPATYTLTGEDDEQALDIRFDQEQITLKPGESQPVKLEVSGPWVYTGASKQRSFMVRARPEQKGEAPTKTAQIIQRVLFPWWLILALMTTIPLIYYYVTLPPRITELTQSPPGRLLGTQVTLNWTTSNARYVRFEGLGITAGPSGPLVIPAETPLPEILRMFAYTQFGMATAATVGIPPPILPTATPTPTVELVPTSAPLPPVEVVVVQTALVVQTQVVELPQPQTVVVVVTETPPPFSPTPVPTQTTAEAAATSGIYQCPARTDIIVFGRGPANQGFLLFFGNRPVSGGVVRPDGTFSINLRIGRERSGSYPVTARLQDTLRPLSITQIAIDRSRANPPDRTVSAVAGIDGEPLTLICEVPSLDGLPTPTPLPPGPAPINPNP